MANADVMFTQAVRAYKSGQKDEARGILMEIVAEYEHHEQAWLLLSGLVETLDEQQICLENVVAINPGNDKALKGLDVINRKIAARDGQPPHSPPTPPVAPTGAEFTPADDPFANAPWASPPPPQQPNFGTPGQANDIFDSWAPFNADAPPADPFGSPSSSVDWSSSDSQAAYGSGKQVELPSNQEYDDWVQGLNLGGGAAAAPNNPFPDEAPFGDTSFMLEGDTNNPFLTNQPATSTDPFGRSALFTEDPNIWEEDSAPFSEEPASPFPSSPPPFSSPELTFDSPPAFGSASDFGGSDSFMPDAGSGPFVFDEQPSKSISFDFDAEDDDDDDLWPGSGDIAPTSIPVFASKQQRAVNVQSEAYFRYIPNEIQPEAGGIEPRSLLMLAGIAVLVILNLVSFGALLM